MSTPSSTVSSVAAQSPIRIANCSGFYGDRLSAAAEMVNGGPIDVLTGDWLAELTMLILAKNRMRKPGTGYARTFLAQMEQVLGSCVDRGIRVVANAGGLDPEPCAEAVVAVAETLGVSARVAVVDGDDLIGRVAELVESGQLRAFRPDLPLGDVTRYLTANAYLGCWPIVDALAQGADVVVTGRVTDAALTCGPAAWHHGWATDDFGAMAGAMVAGHVLECGAQATGGNYSFFTELPAEPVRIGFPWADIAADGSSVIGKHAGTGGAVTVGTVTSQLLYEIGGHSYAGPDAVARFDSIRVTQLDTDRVGIGPVAGEAPPDTLKVAMNELGGFRNEFSIALTGPDIDAKAAFAERVFWDLYPFAADQLDSVTSVVSHTSLPDPITQDAATSHWRLVVKDADDQKVGRVFADAMVQTALASIPGLYAGGAPKGASAFGVYRPALVERTAVTPRVRMLGASSDQVCPIPGAASTQASLTPAHDANAPTVVAEPTAPTQPFIELGALVGTRSGDKGGDANLGVFVRDRRLWPWLVDWLTIDRLAELLPETAALSVQRHEFENLMAVNFVIVGILGDGVASSTRGDAQAKALGEWLRARAVPNPFASGGALAD